MWEWRRCPLLIGRKEPESIAWLFNSSNIYGVVIFRGPDSLTTRKISESRLEGNDERKNNCKDSYGFTSPQNIALFRLFPVIPPISSLLECSNPSTPFSHTKFTVALDFWILQYVFPFSFFSVPPNALVYLVWSSVFALPCWRPWCIPALQLFLAFFDHQSSSLDLSILLIGIFQFIVSHLLGMSLTFLFLGYSSSLSGS